MTNESNPWITRSKKTMYRNDWIHVEEHDVVRPDGADGIYGVVHARLATGVVALNDAGEVCLVGQYRYPTEMYSWEVPEGGADEGESALEAIQRELKEEAGVVARDWEQLGGEIHLTNCHSSEIGYVFLARALTVGQANPEGTEVLQSRFVPLETSIAMIDSGDIVDAITIIALMRAERHLRG